MHKNRHFLVYRKCRHDVENHVHMCALRHSGESLQNGQQPQGNRLGKNPSSNHQRVKLRRHCQQLGLCLFPPCYFIFLEPCYNVRCVVFQSFSLCLLQFSQQARPHKGACLLLDVLFYFPNLSLFVSSYVKMKKFCSFQFNRLAISWPPWVRVGSGQLPVLASHCFFSWLALLFLELYRSFTMYEWEGGGGRLDV